MKLNSYYKKALKGKWAIGQFNFSNLETLKAIIKAAEKMRSPVILGTSEGESKFFGLKQASAVVGAYRKKTGLPIFLNLDHGRTFEYIKKAVDAGYDAVHFDGSSLPLLKNIGLAKKVLKYARGFNVLVEGEVGVIGGKALTNPAQALRFVKEANVDILAVAVGSLHGMDKEEKLDLNRLKEIKKKLGNFPLVLHGGSGVRDKDVRSAVRLGVVKVNVNTELRVAYRKTLKKVFKEKPGETTPYKYMPEVIEEIQRIVEEKIKLFGSKNKA